MTQYDSRHPGKQQQMPLFSFIHQIIQSGKDQRNEYHSSIFSHRCPGIYIIDMILIQGKDRRSSKSRIMTACNMVHTEITGCESACYAEYNEEIVGQIYGHSEASEKSRDIQQKIRVEQRRSIAHASEEKHVHL